MACTGLQVTVAEAALQPDGWYRGGVLRHLQGAAGMTQQDDPIDAALLQPAAPERQLADRPGFGGRRPRPLRPERPAHAEGDQDHRGGQPLARRQAEPASPRVTAKELDDESSDGIQRHIGPQNLTVESLPLCEKQQEKEDRELGCSFGEAIGEARQLDLL